LPTRSPTPLPTDIALGGALEPPGELPPLLSAENPSANPPANNVNFLINTALDQLGQGLITFDPPDQMAVGEQRRITARIIREVTEQAQEQLEHGLGRAGGIPQTQEIKVSSEMEVVLRGANATTFEIQQASEARQAVGQSDFTQWDWFVTPKKSGQQILLLQVTAIIEIPGLAMKTKSLPVLEKTIHINVNPFYEARVFAREYWQWLITTITIPLLGWMYTRRKARATTLTK
jgi:hypothetical protein